jgi:alpha-beta hydrolase superfamily lysophospholipase
MNYVETVPEEWHFPASNGEGDIFARAWLSRKPVAIVQVCHGMSEHGGRYHEFASYLSLHGFSVVANDHAGHGRSAQGHLGSFSAKAGGFDCSIEDLHSLFTLAEERIGVLPRILFGQSMGSIMVGLYAERHLEPTALVMSGTPFSIKFSLLFQLVAGLVSATKGPLARSPLIERLSGSAANLTPEEKKAARFWLSRDNDKVQEFVDDPLCGFDYSAGGYYTMLRD